MSKFAVPLNVDCGTTGNTRTGFLGMRWVGDEQYVKSGQSATVRIDYRFVAPFNTLRYFPDQRKKNCYSFPGVGQGIKILVRAWFYYGNYDGLSSPPTFDLLFNGNPWTRVSLPGSNDSIAFEMVYVTKVDDISVCLARTKPNDVPFINSIEIKNLEKDMYGYMDTDRPLHLRGRYAYASPTTSPVRYPDDIYDRLWFTFTDYASSGLSPLSRSSDPSSNLPDRPPAAVLRQAITPSSSLASNMTVPTPIESPSPVPHYVTFYFVEMLANASRSFDIYLDDQPFYDKTIVPNGTVFEIVGRRVSLSTSSVFSLVRAKGSTLPPLISAAEFYRIGDAWGVDATNSSDVKALSEFQKCYVQLQPWSGDPCLPIGYAWEWVNCSSDFTPRVTTLHLSGYGLTGPLVDFSNLTALQTMQHFGQQFCGQLKRKQLREGGGSWTNYWFAFVLIGLGYACHLHFQEAACKRVNSGKSTALLGQEIKSCFSHVDIVGITNNFEKVIGGGGSGNVYYGRLENGCEVAVKVLKNSHSQGTKEFVAEVKLLMTVHHKCLVSFVGYCEEGANLIVIYEYMSGGDLRKLLSGRTSTSAFLTWDRRLQVALSIAAGLDYLHSGCNPPIIHRDVKTTNILLNATMEAKVADFGLSKAGKKDDVTHLSTVVAGTPGYIDPEYYCTNIVTKKSDVYSFGVVLFELITGRAPFFDVSGERFHIVQWATARLVRGDIQSVADPKLGAQYEVKSMWKVADLAMSCTSQQSHSRPHMSDVANQLKEAIEVETYYRQRTVPVNVDCGTTGKNKGYLGLTWVGDEQYVPSGQSTTVKIDDSLIAPLTTLRYFPSGKKNCYSFPGVGQGIKILVRAWFYYGNYDGLSSPPTFNVLFNGNLWSPVFMTGDNGSAILEMIHATKVDDVSVCLARTNAKDVPFINALEIRKLEAEVWAVIHLLLLLSYPDDPYDRLWFIFSNYASGLSPLSRSSDPLSNLADRPPAAVLRQAITPSSSLASNMTIPNLITSTSPVPHYVTFYFVEMSSNATRSFDFFLDNERFYSKTIVTNGTVLEIFHPKVNLSTSSVFSLVRANGSALPPLISAAEFFKVGDIWAVAATDSSDGMPSLSLTALSLCHPSTECFLAISRSYVDVGVGSSDGVECASEELCATPAVERRSLSPPDNAKPTALLEPEIKHEFSHAEIVEITNNFETVIGEGGSGNVYYGRLKNGREVAVKVLKDSLEQGIKEFVAEVKLLMTVHHKCLVSFIGYCEEDGKLILLYEYMSGGNLRQLLSGLDYLHSGCYPQIIHRDVKTTNILLNAKMEAKVADFGLSKACHKDDVTQLPTVVAGTPGYIDPEYYRTNLVTKKSDVYSFGVVLFELMTGYAPLFNVSGERFHIVEWATSRLTRGDIHSVADPRLGGQYEVNSMWKVADIAMSCTAPSSEMRPHMSDVVIQLKEAIEAESYYQQRTGNSSAEVQHSSSSYGFSSSHVSNSSLPPARYAFER
ncbi:putative LRR receptor-like serine/threonine-protein kinase [Nymphaea thermarum]|nr:putative LRR receptor-like serine/threonine-protein kinase [Nymphaea thermarum]